MKNYIFCIVLSSTFLSVKSHIIKVVILAILGLTGLWLLHVLAQDYQQIQRPNKKWLSKRSIDYQHVNYTSQWSTIWFNDPFGCVKSFICQLAANETNLDDYSRGILNLARFSLMYTKSAATEVLEKSIFLGKRSSSGDLCFDTYRLCPFSDRSMIKILNLIQN